MKTSEVLDAAAAYLTLNGWQQLSMGQPGGPRCVMGAFKSVLGEESIVEAVSTPAYLALRNYLDDDWVSEWNDADGRTAAEVIEVLRAAAVIEAARESAPQPAPALTEAVASS